MRKLRQGRFVLVTLVSVIAALVTGMFLQIEAPYWAATTVLIVATPVRAHVIQKSIARVCGSLLGALVGIAMIAAFAQAPAFFVAALACWIATCAAMSSHYRAFHAYAWVLAGYTTAIIAVQAAQKPELVFTIALSRLSAVTVGLACFGLFNTVLGAPGTARSDFLRRFDALRTELLAWSATRIGDRDHVPPRPGLIADILLLEAAVGEVVAENRDLGRDAARLRGALAALLSVYSLTLFLVSAPWARDHPGDAETGRQRHRLVALLRAEGDADAGRRDALHLAMSLRRTGGFPLRMAQARLRMARLARAIAEARAIPGIVAGKRVRGGPSRRVSRSPDWHDAIRNGLRCLAAVVTAGGFWIATAWPSGATYLLITAIMVSLYSTRPNPRDASRKAVWAVVASSLVACFLKFAVLPEAGDALPVLILVIAPAIAGGAAAILHPRLAGYAATFNFLMLTQMEVQNRMDYDFVEFINAAVATTAGVATAALWFDIFPVESSGHRTRRLLRSMRRTALSLATDRRARAEVVISRLHGYLGQILPGLDETDGVRAGATLQLAFSLDHLRLLLRPPRGLSPEMAARCRRALNSLPSESGLEAVEARLAADAPGNNATAAALLAVEDIRLCLRHVR
ncbi:MAG: FUSC family protein [Gluconacetobacter diazotrophicus]|nr:FUSC family protein [Gluconacetobacter diazotrophicus]